MVPVRPLELLELPELVTVPVSVLIVVPVRPLVLLELLEDPGVLLLTAALELMLPGVLLLLLLLLTALELMLPGVLLPGRTTVASE